MTIKLTKKLADEIDAIVKTHEIPADHWSDDEDGILLEYIGKVNYKGISKILALHGFSRSAGAVEHRIRRLR